MAGSAVGVAAAVDAVEAAAGCAEGDVVAGGGGTEPLIAAANAVRLARAVVSLALVSSSKVTAAVAFEGEVPVVPVGFDPIGVVALAAPVADVSVGRWRAAGWCVGGSSEVWVSSCEVSGMVKRVGERSSRGGCGDSVGLLV